MKCSSLLVLFGLHSAGKIVSPCSWNLVLFLLLSHTISRGSRKRALVYQPHVSAHVGNHTKMIKNKECDLMIFAVHFIRGAWARVAKVNLPRVGPRVGRETLPQKHVFFMLESMLESENPNLFRPKKGMHWHRLVRRPPAVGKETSFFGTQALSLSREWSPRPRKKHHIYLSKCLLCIKPVLSLTNQSIPRRCNLEVEQQQQLKMAFVVRRG